MRDFPATGKREECQQWRRRAIIVTRVFVRAEMRRASLIERDESSPK